MSSWIPCCVSRHRSDLTLAGTVLAQAPVFMVMMMIDDNAEGGNDDGDDDNNDDNGGNDVDIANNDDILMMTQEEVWLLWPAGRMTDSNPPVVDQEQDNQPADQVRRN